MIAANLRFSKTCTFDALSNDEASELYGILLMTNYH
jgi:hypothetical protein